MNTESNTSQFPVSQVHFCRQIKSLNHDMSTPMHVVLSCECEVKRAERVLNPDPGNETEIIISSYEDHFLVVATQIGTMGTIMYARKEEGVSINPTFNVSVIFGKRDEPMLVACARQLIEHMSVSGSSRPLVLSLGLKDHSVETLKGIISAVIESRMW